MIGILCNQKNEDVLAMKIHSLLESEVLANHSAIVVFSIKNLDLNNGIVFGSTVSKYRVKQVETVLPDIIFNLSVQYKSRHIKRFREIIDLKAIAVINASNKYDQCMVTDILMADDATRRFVLPYFKYSIYEPLYGIEGDGALLIKPEKKSGLSKITLTDTSLSGVDLSGRKGGKWICMRVPELIKYNNLPVVVRIHMQRLFSGKWSILDRCVIPEDRDVNIRFIDKAADASLEIVRLLHCFLTHLGICYTDIIFDTLGNPFLLNFGGYDDGLLKGQNTDMQARFFRNMLEYARGFTNKPNGVLSYVD